MTLVCRSAARLPTTNETIATAADAVCQTSDWPGNAVTSTRRITISAIALVAADMKVVTGVGAPS